MSITYNTSGLNSWVMTEQDIIKRALRLVGAIGTGDSPNSNEYADARMALNGVIQGLINEGAGMWRREWVTQSFNPLSRVVGSDGSNYYCLKPHTATDDNKPVTGENFQTFWDNGESTLTAWVSGASFTSSNQFTYTNDIIDIEKMFVRDGGYDYMVEKISLDDFFALGSKSSFTTTMPTNFAVENKLNNSIVHLYPLPIVDTDVKIHMLVTKRIYDTDTTGENVDLPVEWLESLTYLLASRLSDEYHLDIQERSWILNKAEELKRRAMGKESRDFSSSFVSPCFNYRGY
jgi:hypothetical protein